MKKYFLLSLMLVSSLVWASGATTSKQIDSIQNSTGGSSLAVPSVGVNIVSDTATQTMTNKSMSGASNTFTAIPASAVSSGQLGVANGGTGVATLAVHGVVIGNAASAVSVSSAGTSGQVLTSNGASADPTFQPVPTGLPVLNGSQASPQSVTAAGGVSLSGLSAVNLVFVVSNSGAVTVTATPSITACTTAGQIVYLLGESATNTIKLQDNSALANSKLLLNGNWTSGLNSMLELMCDGNGFWVEFARQ